MVYILVEVIAVELRVGCEFLRPLRRFPSLLRFPHSLTHPIQAREDQARYTAAQVAYNDPLQLHRTLLDHFTFSHCVIQHELPSSPPSSQASPPWISLPSLLLASTILSHPLSRHSRCSTKHRITTSLNLTARYLSKRRCLQACYR